MFIEEKSSLLLARVKGKSQSAITELARAGVRDLKSWFPVLPGESFEAWVMRHARTES